MIRKQKDLCLTELETFSTKKLESLLCSAPYRFAAFEEEKDAFRWIMHERSRRLNRKFKWTEENKNRMVKVSDAFSQAWEDGFANAKKIIKALPRTRGKYSFSIILYPEILNLEKTADIKMYNKIIDRLNPEFELSMQFHNETPAKNEKKFKESIHVKRDLNWNIEGLGGIEFEDRYICYTLHILYAHNGWAFEDILKINNISTEIRISCESGEF